MAETSAMAGALAAPVPGNESRTYLARIPANLNVSVPVEEMDAVPTARQVVPSVDTWTV